MYLAAFGVKIAALFSEKFKLFTKGRKGVFDYIAENISDTDQVIWFHTASLGEFEQGLPVIKQTKEDFPDYKILVTFFSPSGYEVKKNTDAADLVCYLPLDIKRNVIRFLSLVKPKLAVFVKYEFWPNYLNMLKEKEIPTLLVSGIFREDQAFFHSYGSFMRKSLKAFDRFFVQNEKSKQLLEKIGFDNVEVSGDTRFDRVAEILERDNTLSFVEDFKQDKMCFVAGSTWPEDENLITEYINKDNSEKIKYIIAPHVVDRESIDKLLESIHKKTVLFSDKEGKQLQDFDVLIIDTVGLLTKIYSYADIAYVGGGMGTKGLHNTLEPAVFGIPVIIGKRYKGFEEAENLVELGGIISVFDKKEFASEMTNLIENQSVLKERSEINKKFINKNKGAKVQIGYYIRKLIE
ncbi:3-deoxy-D-manno-octulosonic acid transferase [Galbibacter sp. EGI 63066]|uniref:3-deoxy-D-manno-octulosonic acid transferase n=1 Tax=Galbibacter sp. EGI 63066 TaxID=2993559 RepID=UPI002B0560A8|nr:glycosyltransferase N-terminal domain-containing protein [Galbibacter sp. EGI 63066]